MREGAEAVRLLVRDVTLLARGSPRRERLVDLREVVHAALRVAGPRMRGVATLREAVGTAPRVRGDAVQFLQVVVNVLLNAADACEESLSESPEVVVTSRPALTEAQNCP